MLMRLTPLLSSLILIFAAGIAFGAEKKSPEQPPKPDIVLNNLDFGDYRYALWINDEPIHSSSGLSIRSWSGYPIKHGDNRFRFEAQSLRPDASVTTSAEISSSNQIKSIKLNLAKPDIDETNDFHLQINPAPPTILFDNLNATTNEIQKLKEFVINFAQQYSHRDFKAIARIGGITENEVRLSFPRWISESAASSIQTSAVGNAKDLEVLSGKRFILIRPTIAYARDHNPALAHIKKSDGSAEINIPCVTFSKQADVWFVLGLNLQWTRIQL